VFNTVYRQGTEWGCV